MAGAFVVGSVSAASVGSVGVGSTPPVAGSVVSSVAKVGSVDGSVVSSATLDVPAIPVPETVNSTFIL